MDVVYAVILLLGPIWLAATEAAGNGFLPPSGILS
jgi:hypothetical protein